MNTKRRRDKIVSFWMTGGDYAILQRLAESQDSTVSQIARSAIRRELTEAGLVQVSAEKELACDN